MPENDKINPVGSIHDLEEFQQLVLAGRTTTVKVWVVKKWGGEYKIFPRYFDTTSCINSIPNGKNRIWFIDHEGHRTHAEYPQPPEDYNYNLFHLFWHAHAYCQHLLQAEEGIGK